MRYLDDMFEEYGFSDGESTPEGMDAYRAVYVKGLNALLEKYNSNIRVFACNRFNLYNWCMIIRAPKAMVDTMSSPWEAQDLEELDIINVTLDEGYHDALDEAYDWDFDDFVEVRITAKLDKLDHFIVNELGE